MLNKLAFKHFFSFPGLIWLWGVVPLFLIDQISKWFVLQHLTWGETKNLLPGLQLIRAHNYGVAFSLFNQQIPWMQQSLLLLGSIICLGVMIWLLKTPRQEKWCGFALMAILGGALGNLFDRFYHGFVVDFIDFYILSWHWYTFNLADSFISLGAIMLGITILFSPQTQSKTNDPSRGE